MSIFRTAVNKPVTTALIFLAFAILGVFALTRLPVDNFPDIESNTIMVMSSYPGASAEDVENNLTKVLENSLNGVSNLKDITSNSRENISVLTLEFEYGTDIEVATNDVRDKLDMVVQTLPDGASSPTIFKFSADDMPIMILSATADQSVSALDKILDDKVATPLARVSGVGTVSVSGAPNLPWKGGLASHGGTIAILLGIWWYASRYGRKNGFDYVWVIDHLVIPVAFAACFIRLGNLFNSEIYGAPTDLPWGFVFERNGETVPCHPTQLYEAGTYLLLGLVLMWLYWKKLDKMYRGTFVGIFLIVCFGSRFLIEFIKNDQVEFEADMVLNMGQLLSIPFVLLGIGFLVYAYKKKQPARAVPPETGPRKKEETHYARPVNQWRCWICARSVSRTQTSRWRAFRWASRATTTWWLRWWRITTIWERRKRPGIWVSACVTPCMRPPLSTWTGESWDRPNSRLPAACSCTLPM